MTLYEQGRQALQQATGPQRLSFADGGQRLVCELTTLDSLACAFTSFQLETAALAGATPEKLKRLGESLAGRLNYLLEPISAVELDRDSCVMQLRSNPPQREDDLTSYYELVVRRGGALSLCRFSKAPGDVRQVVPANVTREVLLRLVKDFSAAAA